VVHKIYYDNIHEETRHAVGDWVWFSLHQRATASHQAPTPGKLKPHFYGPYRNAVIINDVTYRLELLACARMQDVFHVGLLKKFVGAPPTTPPALPSIHHGAAVLEPEPWRAPNPRPLEGRTCFISFMGGHRQLRQLLPPTSSLRTSCSSRREMSCGAARTNNVAARRAPTRPTRPQQTARSARSGRRPQQKAREACSG